MLSKDCSAIERLSAWLKSNEAASGDLPSVLAFMAVQTAAWTCLGSHGTDALWFNRSVISLVSRSTKSYCDLVGAPENNPPLVLCHSPTGGYSNPRIIQMSLVTSCGIVGSTACIMLP